MAHPLRGLDAGTLQEHLAQLQAQIRAQPQQAPLRLALCHFLAVQGQWPRALDQARQARTLDVALTPAAASCEMALRAEQARDEVWQGRAAPTLLGGDPPEWLTGLVRAAALAAGDAPAGAAQEAAELRARALEQAPALAGTVTVFSRTAPAEEDLEPTEVLPFAWVADGDARLGPVLELFTAQGYGWLPMSALRQLVFSRPRHLVDLLWAPVEMTLRDGTQGSALLPVRYADLGTGADDALLLARRTDWEALGQEGQYRGFGQRMLISDAGDVPWLELRRIEWQP